MFIDASIIIAILGREAGHEELERRLASMSGPFFVSPLVTYEASVSLASWKSGKRKPTPGLLRQARDAVEAFIESMAAEEVAVSAEVGRLAVEASATYGKAVGHIADLNFGDCFAYACAKALKVPLLYKGNDFIHTDLA